MNKGGLLYISILLIGIIFIGKLFYLQVLDNPYKISPLNNASIKQVYDYPERGYIYDRNGELLVANQQSYDVMIVPREVKPLDTIEFCNLLKIDKQDFIKLYTKAQKYSPRLASVFINHVSKDDYAYLQEKLHKFKGFYIQKRSIRQYPMKTAANALGYISEVNQKQIKENGYYQQGELIGVKGVERSKIGSHYKYYYGNSSNYDEILKYRKIAKEKGFPSAFVVAFKNEERISISDLLNSSQ